MPLISIVTPVFNGEKYLHDTIQSVLTQTEHNWEWLLIDDKSSDASVEIIQQYVEQDSRLRLLELDRNSGAAIARNTGTSEARGRYLAFLDSDDMWVSEKLAIQLAFMREHNTAFSFAGYEFADIDGKPTGKKVEVPSTMRYRDALRNTTIWTSTVMIDLQQIDKSLCYMPNVRRGQDSATWWKILRETEFTADGIPGRPLALYRKTHDSLSSNPFRALKRTWDNYRNIEKLNIFDASVNFIFYVFHAIRRRI